MSHYRKIGLLIFAMLIILVATIMAQLKDTKVDSFVNHGQKRGQVDEEQWPLTDYEKPLPADPEKRAKRLATGKRFDNPKLKVDRNANFGQAILNDHWQLTTPALPANQSNIILIGEILSSQAYLSNNKSGIYSEFEIRIERVLKDENQTLIANTTIDVEREGGRVKLPSGQVTRYSINGQYMPRVGKRYLLFLTCSDPAQVSQIITGYELREGKVFSLDGPGDTFALYKWADETSFLTAVQDAISHPSQSSPK